MAHICLFVCWLVSHLLPAFCPTQWSDGPESPAPCGGAAAPFAHVMRRLKGIWLESNDLLAHAGLGIRLQLTYCVTHGALHGAETHGEPPL